MNEPVIKIQKNKGSMRKQNIDYYKTKFLEKLSIEFNLQNSMLW